MPIVEKVENKYQIKSESHPLPSACFCSVIYFNTLPWQFIYFYTIIFSGCRTAVKCFHNLWWPVSHYRTWYCSQFEAIIKILWWTPFLVYSPLCGIASRQPFLVPGKIFMLASSGVRLSGRSNISHVLHTSVLHLWNTMPGWQWGLKTQGEEVPEGWHVDGAQHGQPQRVTAAKGTLGLDLKYRAFNILVNRWKKRYEN